VIALFIFSQGWLEYENVDEKWNDLTGPIIANSMVMVCVDLPIFIWYFTIVFRLMSQAEKE
jgi:hypothetical protein